MSYRDPASIENFTPNYPPTANLQWIRQSFMLPNLKGEEISALDITQRIATSAAFKYTDTTLGGNYAINSPPQYTEFADVTMGGDQTLANAVGRTLMTTTNGRGMGRKYSELIDDNAQLVTMRFGVKDFNSLSSFFGSFFDPRASQLVRTGRAPGIFYRLGQVTGELLAFPFQPIILGSQIIRSAAGIPSTKFSYFKPTMPLYWNAVNNMLNGITANLGVHYRQLSAQQKVMYVDKDAGGIAGSTASGQAGSIEQEIALLHQVFPDIYNAAGGIDIYAVSNRAQRLADAYTAKLQDALKNATSTKDLQKRLQAAIGSNLVASTSATPTLTQALNKYLNGPAGNTQHGNGGTDVMSADVPDSPPTDTATTNPGGNSGATGNATPTTTPAPATTGVSGLYNRISTWFHQYWDSLKSDLRDGSQYVTFRTEYGGSIGESFSSSMRESDLAQKINSQSSQSSMTSYDFAGGNIVGGALGSITGAVLGTVKDTIMGVAAGLHISGLAALAGAAYVDIPKLYDSSTVSMPTQSFTIELRSWSGHHLSLLQNIYVPLAMLLAGALPRSTGVQSYNGPFSCQLFARGRMQVRDGLITDMSITRGTGNIGWSADMLPLGVDITFTVTDFSSMMHMPMVSASGFLDLATNAVGQSVDEVAKLFGSNSTVGVNTAAWLNQGTYTDDSLFADYLAIITGLSWRDQLYPARKWSIARDRQKLNYASFKSPYHAASFWSGTWTGRMISGFVRGTDRP